MSFLKDYFAFTKRERNGVFVLLIIIVATVVAKSVIPYITDLPQFDKIELVAVEPKIEKNKPLISEEVHLFKFNPNGLQKEKWRLLGLSDKQLKTIYKYEAAGGYFKDSTDLKKMYCITAEMYHKLQPYVDIPKPKKNLKEGVKEDIHLFPFNPNQLPHEKWRLLGLKDWQIKIIYNYENKGGTFRNKSDLEKIYGIKPELFKSLEPYITIPGGNALVKVQLFASGEKKDLTPSNFKGLEKTNFYKEKNLFKYTYGEAHSSQEANRILMEAKKAGYGPAFLVAFKNGIKIPVSQAFNKTEESQKEKVQIEINSADSLALVSVRGIGPSYASRIIKYRKLLGGFTELSQLKQVYGITESTFQKLEPSFTLDKAKMPKININKCDFVQLVRHPYINKNVANSLIRYRERHGLFRTVESIKGSDLVNEELYSKIAPHLTTD